MTWYVSFSRNTIGYMDYVRYLERVEQASARGETEFTVDLGNIAFCHPDGMAPLVAHIRSMVSKGRKVQVVLPTSADLNEYFETVGWMAGIVDEDPPPPRRGTSYLPLTPFRDYETLNSFITRAVEILGESQAFPRGVLEGFEFSINEIADNVINHAASDEPGWLQLTSYPNKQQVEFVVVDTGRGIRASLSEAYPNLTSDEDAVVLAVKQGTTRNREIGQGNGLSGTLRIAAGARGWANLHSGTGQLRMMEGDIHTASVAKHPGTLVTVTLPTGRELDVSEALWGHVVTPAFQLKYEGDHGINFRVRDEASNYGNRATGIRLRNKLTNVMVQMPGEAVLVDFDGVDMVTASFADEFLGKLAKEMGGLTAFYGQFRFANMSQFVASTIDRVIVQRLSVE